MPLVTKVTDSVYCVQRRDYLSCSYLVVQENGIVMIDAGIDPTAGDMLSALDELGRTVDEVRAILLTHWHNDHSSGAAIIQQASSARIYYHEAGHAKFTREARAGGLRGWIANRLPAVGFWGPLRGLLELAPPHAVNATEFIKDGDTVEDCFRVVETPGHEVGHVSYLFEPEGVLFAGDALAIAHDRIVFMSRFLTEDKQAAKQSMLRCLDLPLKAICPGHRYPLVDPAPDEIARIREVVQKLKWWPIIGC